MTKQITNKEFNQTKREVANFLSWETDVRNIESVLMLWTRFQAECEKGQLASNWREAQRLLLQVVTEYAA
jgi:hypothetical protein